MRHVSTAREQRPEYVHSAGELGTCMSVQCVSMAGQYATAVRYVVLAEMSSVLDFTVWEYCRWVRSVSLAGQYGTWIQQVSTVGEYS